MSQLKKLTDADFSEIRKMQEKHHEITLKLGNLQIEKMELDRLVSQYVDREKNLKEEWQEFQKLDKGLAEKVLATYGEGKINMDDGTFTPIAPLVMEEQRKV